MPDNPVVCPVLIGRADYVLTLQNAMQQANAFRVLTLAGEAGIGKSRLIGEALACAEQCGLLPLEGHCFELDRTLPYAPFVDLLQTFAAVCPPDEVARAIGPVANELIRLVPELATRLPDVLPATPLEPEPEKRRLFQAIAQWFTKLSTRQALMVIIEDLHWSDDTSLEVLQYLARWLTARPILLLMTYRPEEASPTLTHFLAEIDRTHVGAEIQLKPLTMPDVDAMVRAIFNLDRPTRVEFLDAIYGLTEGNPFFIEEVLKSLIAAGDIFFADGVWGRKPMGDLHIPRSVHDAVRRRVAQLSEPARRVLVLAAAAGRRFDFELLQVLIQSNESVLLQWIKEMIAAQLVVEESAERFAFRHALTRQAIYTELLARERKTLHRTILQAMEQLYGPSLEALEAGAGTHLADLAYHAYEAEAWEKALVYSERAGMRARALYAPREAVEHFTRAQDAARRLSRPIPASLYRARGQAYELLGSFAPALADHELGLNASRSAQDGVGEWQSLIDLGFLWAERDYERTGQHFRRAAELAQTLADPILYARSLNRLGNWLVNIGQTEEALQVHHQALDIFEARQDQAGAAETHDLMGMANALYGDMAAAGSYSRHAIALFRELDDKRSPVSDFAVLNADVGFSEPVFWAPRTLEECERESAEAFSLARQLDWPAGQAQIEWSMALAVGAFGEFGKALAHGAEALHIAVEIEHQQWTAAAYTALGQTYTMMLQPIEALQNLEKGLPLALELGSAYWIGNITCYLAHAHLMRNEPQRAEAVLSEAMPFDRAPRNLPERRMMWAWGRVMLARGDPGAALHIADQLIGSAPGMDRSQPIPALLNLRGEALMALGRFEEAQQALKEARLGAASRGAGPLLWQIHAVLATLYRRVRRAADAQRESVAALEIIRTLAATIDDVPLREGFMRAALQKLPTEKPLSARRAAKERFGGLTERERQVAALIMQGKSNREIGEALVLTEPTVKSHVGNILSKLGFTTRAQIAAWAAEKELVDS